jgi:hypothetical protein
MSDLIVNLGDESITGVEGSVWVKNWPDGDPDLDNDDVVNYAERHGLPMTRIIEFATKIATLVTGDEGLDRLPDPNDPDQIIESVQEYKHDAPDILDDLIVEARALIGRTS